MADYVVGSLSFVQDGSGADPGFNYLGRPQGYRGLCTRQKITLNARCRVTRFSYSGYFQGAANKSFKCIINQNSGWYSNAVATGSVSLSGSNLRVGSVTCSFNAELPAGEYYVWIYWTDSAYGCVGNGANPFSYTGSAIERMVPDMVIKAGGAKRAIAIWQKVNGQAKAVTELVEKTAAGGKRA